MRQVEEILEARRRSNELSLEARKDEIFTKFPQMKDLSRAIKENSIKKFNYLVSGKDTSELTKKLDQLNKEFNHILTSNNYPLDYLKMQYHCDKCKDTGSVGTKICTCKKQLMTNKLYQDTGVSEIIKEENFENFDISLFRKDRQANEVISPYENIKAIKEELYQYANHFDEDSVNLYIFGKVGTGKTYLLNSITKEVLDQGYSVLYLSESDLVNKILLHRFSYSEEKAKLQGEIDTIFNSDLLIIDDLGTNNTNDASKSAIFEVINSRLVKKKPVVISSNLNPEELRETYDARIYSRIVGKYYQKRLFGNDVRMQLWKWLIGEASKISRPIILKN